MNCDICGISDSVKKIKKIKGMSLCPKHITQWYRYHKFSDITIYDKNDFISKGDICEIVIRNKNCEEIGRAIIDKEDYDICSKYKWHIKNGKNTKYAMAHINDKKVFLHRFILGYSGNMDIDHINRNGLDNRKCNLRIVSYSTNLSNQSENRKGIRKTKSGKYQARITINYKTYYIGVYESYNLALESRNEFEKTYRSQK